LRLALSVLSLASAAPAAHAMSRIKDIVQFEGVRGNKLVGYGIVVGLAGTGDSLRNVPEAKQTLEAMLERLGVNTKAATMDTKDVAAVIVTAELPPFAAAGSSIDITVSAMGDAKSLQGGTLMVTPLLGSDGEAYALGQGAIETGAISAGGASGSSISRGVPTVGRIASGASVERESGFKLNSLTQMRLTLRNPDFTTARRIADVINAHFAGCAEAQNPTIVTVHTPPGRDMVSFMPEIEELEIEPDTPAKVMIDETSGTIVIGENVRLSTVAIDHGNLTISVQETPQVSQPLPFSQGTTTVTPQSRVKVDEEKGKRLMVLNEGATLSSLVAGLNALGLTPRDIISILQVLKADGALQADLEVM
jgi:flagellar P-ring protein precursor FlgI